MDYTGGIYMNCLAKRNDRLVLPFIEDQPENIALCSTKGISASFLTKISVSLVQKREVWKWGEEREGVPERVKGGGGDNQERESKMQEREKGGKGKREKEEGKEK